MRLSKVLAGIMFVHGILSVAADLDLVLSEVSGPQIELRINNSGTENAYVLKSRLPDPSPTEPNLATEASLFSVAPVGGGPSPTYIGAMVKRLGPSSFP